MAYSDDGSVEDMFEGVPCEFCKFLFPFEEIVIHETGCEYDLVRVTESLSGVDIAEEETKSNKQSPAKKQNLEFETPLAAGLEMGDEEFNKLIEILIAPETEKTTPAPKKATTLKEETPKRKEPVKDNFQDFEVLEDHLQENEPFTFASGKNKEKRVEKEKPSFKKPVNLNFSNKDMKCQIQNDLPDSDNEENESLEKFWKRAEIKLAQRLRAIEKQKQAIMAEKL